MKNHDQTIFNLSDEVEKALIESRPTVGLESSVISGGKWPNNYEWAIEIDNAIRAAGATPVRFAIMDGKIKAGLSPDEIERLATSSDMDKAGSRDLAWAISNKLIAGTTVSASLIGCTQLKIPIFSVAGIGGAHYGASESFDISTDLMQFAKSRVAVVCAGAKSMIDPKLTLEILETHGIPVIGYQSEFFPGYYTQSSGEKVPLLTSSIELITKIMNTHWNLPSAGSLLVTHPIDEADSLDSKYLKDVVDSAIADCKAKGIKGKEVTPTILKAISRATSGKSDVVNKSVLLSTAKLASKLANAYKGNQYV